MCIHEKHRQLRGVFIQHNSNWRGLNKKKKNTQIGCLRAWGYKVSIEWAARKLNAYRKRIRVCHRHATSYCVRSACAAQRIASLHYFPFNNYAGLSNCIIWRGIAACRTYSESRWILFLFPVSFFCFLRMLLLLLVRRIFFVAHGKTKIGKCNQLAAVKTYNLVFPLHS